MTWHLRHDTDGDGEHGRIYVEDRDGTVLAVVPWSQTAANRLGAVAGQRLAEQIAALGSVDTSPMRSRKLAGKVDNTDEQRSIVG